MGERLGAEQIAGALEQRALKVLRHLFPNGHRHGHEFCVGSLAGERGKSLKVHLNGKGPVWKDFATGQGGADLLDLWAAARHNGDLKPAMREAAAWLGLEVGPPPEGARRGNGQRRKGDDAGDARASAEAVSSEDDKEAWQPVIPVPPGEEKSIPPWESLFKGRIARAPDYSFQYRDAQGRLRGYILRWEFGPKDKIHRPFTFCRSSKERTAWRSQGFGDPLPLFGEDQLARKPGAVALLLEGEKKAALAGELIAKLRELRRDLPQLVAVSFPHGAEAMVRGDMTALKGRGVIGWPDAQAAGINGMRAFLEKATRAGVDARMVELLPGLPEAWDLGNAVEGRLPEGLTLEGIAELIATAPPVQVRRPVIDVLELNRLEFPPHEYLLEPILPTKGIIEIAAFRGVGKTYVGLSCASVLSIGGRFLRYAAPKPRRVLYVDGEMDAAELQERTRAITAAFGNPEPGFFKLWTPDVATAAGFGVPDLSTPGGQEALEPYLEDVDAVFVDNISTLCRTGVENEAETWLPVQDWALGLRRRGKAVVFIHHMGWTKEHGRGSSRRQDVMNTVLHLKEVEDYGDGVTSFEIHLTKKRGVVGRAAAPIEASFCIRDGAIEWTHKELRDAELDDVLELHAQGLTQRAISKKLGISVGKVNALIKKARGGDGDL